MKYKNKKRYSLFILLDFYWNEVYLKYTSDFEKKYVNLGNPRTQMYFWVSR